MHFRACCHPSYEDFEAIRDLYRENGPASEEIQKILDEILNGIMSSPLGFLALYDIYSGKAPAEPRRARKRLQVFSELPPAEYRRAIVQGK
jgi:hypothetical protein